MANGGTVRSGVELETASAGLAIELLSGCGMIFGAGSHGSTGTELLREDPVALERVVAVFQDSLELGIHVGVTTPVVVSAVADASRVRSYARGCFARVTRPDGAKVLNLFRTSCV